MLAAAGFIMAIKWLNSPATARRGVVVGEIGMLLAVVGTLLRFDVVNYQWIFVAFFLGTAIGIPVAYMDADDRGAHSEPHFRTPVARWLRRSSAPCGILQRE